MKKYKTNFGDIPEDKVLMHCKWMIRHMRDAYHDGFPYVGDIFSNHVEDLLVQYSNNQSWEKQK